MSPSAALLSRLRRGINAENIVGGRNVLYAADTWTTLDARGFSHARIPCDMLTVLPGTYAPKVNADAMRRLDATIKAVTDMDWAVSLCPFGSGSLPNVDIIRQTLDLFTRRYAHISPDHLAFELRNEPHQFSADEWNAAVPDLVATIRANAPDHTIIIPPVLHANVEALAWLIPVSDPNVIYTAHFYKPAQLTQQGQNGTPINPAYLFPAPAGTPGSTGLYTLDKLAREVKAAADWAKLHGVPVMIGEFGCASDAPLTQRLAWIAAMVSTIESHPEIIGWLIWGVDGRKFGLRPHNLAGAWDMPLLDTVAPLKANP